MWTFTCHQDQANPFIPRFVYNSLSVSPMFSAFINMGTEIFLGYICPVLGRGFKIKQWLDAIADREICLCFNQLPAIFFSPDIQLSNWELKILKYWIVGIKQLEWKYYICANKMKI